MFPLASIKPPLSIRLRIDCRSASARLSDGFFACRSKMSVVSARAEVVSTGQLYQVPRSKTHIMDS